MARIYCTDAGEAISGNPSNLCWIHPTTGHVTTIGSIGFNDVLSLAYDFDADVLYGITQGTPTKLITINRTTGAGTLVANMLGSPIAFSGAIVVAGVLYAWYEASTPTDQLAVIDKVTGDWQSYPALSLSSDRDSLGYDQTTGNLYVKGGNTIFPLTVALPTVTVNVAGAFSIVGGGGIQKQGFTFSSSGVAYAESFITGAANQSLLIIKKPFAANTDIQTIIYTDFPQATRRLVALTWVPDAYVPPTVKPIPPPQAPAPQTPCAPKSEIGNGGKGQFGCNNGGVGWTSSYAGPYGTVPQHEDPPDGETLTGKEHAGVEAWMRLYHRDYPSGVVTMFQRSLVELADPPAYEFGRKSEGLLSIGDIEHAIGNEQGGFEASTVDLQLSDAIDRTVRILLDDQDLEGDEVDVLMASDAARGAA